MITAQDVISSLDGRCRFAEKAKAWVQVLPAELRIVLDEVERLQSYVDKLECVIKSPVVAGKALDAALAISCIGTMRPAQRDAQLVDAISKVYREAAKTAKEK